jgi:hypothetical protein
MFENVDQSCQINTVVSRKRSRATFESGRSSCKKCRFSNSLERKRVKTHYKVEESQKDSSEQICSHLMSSIMSNAGLIDIVAKQMTFDTEVEKYYSDQQ